MTSRRDEESWDKQKFKEQCFLMSLWRPVSDLYRQQTYLSMLPHEKPTKTKPVQFHGVNEPRGSSRLEYISLIDSEVPELSKNVFLSRKGFAEFLGLEPKVESLLVPKLELYKIYEKENTGKELGERTQETDTEFYNKTIDLYRIPFPNNTTTDEAGGDAEFTKARENLRGNYGIKSFSVKTENTNPSVINLWMEAKLEIYFANIKEMFIDRDFSAASIGTVPFKRKGRISDLITLLGVDAISEMDIVKNPDEEASDNAGSSDSQDENAGENSIKNADINFGIIARMGWASPGVAALERLGYNRERAIRIDEAIINSTNDFIMRMYGYNFKIDQNGSGVVSIDYMASLDSVYDSKFFDLLNAEISREDIAEEIGKQAAGNSANDRVMIAASTLMRSRRNSDACRAFIQKHVDRQVGQGKFYKILHQHCGRNIKVKKEDIDNVLGEGSSAEEAVKDFARSISRQISLSKGVYDISLTADIKAKKKIITDYWKNRRQVNKMDDILHQGKTGAFYSKYTQQRLHEMLVRNVKGFGDRSLIERKIIAKYKIRKFRNIMTSLYEDGKVYFIDIDTKLYRSWRSWLSGGKFGISNGDKFVPYDSNMKMPAPKTKGTGPPIITRGRKSKKAAPPANDHEGRYIDEKTKIVIYNIKEALEGKSQRVLKPKPINIRRVNFVYFGDLIDAAVKTIVDNISQGDPESEDVEKIIAQIKKRKILLGSVTLQDRFDITKNSKGVTTTVNLGDLPVSLHSYSVWFQKRAANLDLSQWSLKNFVLSCAKSLIGESLGYGCDSRISQSLNISATTFHNYCRGNKKTFPIPDKGRVIVNDEVYRCYGENDTKTDIDNCLQQRLNDNEGLVGFNSDPASVKIDARQPVDMENIRSYLYISSDNLTPDTPTEYMKGNKDYDEKIGIYHLNLGSSKGLVRKIDYAQETDPLLQASRIVDATKKGNLGNQLRQEYNANITTTGNTVLTPGTYVFIRPELPGINVQDTVETGTGDLLTTNLAERLGLGGYYVILGVDYRLSENDFIATFDTKQEASFIAVKEFTSKTESDTSSRRNEDLFTPRSYQDLKNLAKDDKRKYKPKLKDG